METSSDTRSADSHCLECNAPAGREDKKFVDSFFSVILKS